MKTAKSPIEARGEENPTQMERSADLLYMLFIRVLRAVGCLQSEILHSHPLFRL